MILVKGEPLEKIYLAHHSPSYYLRKLVYYKKLSRKPKSNRDLPAALMTCLVRRSKANSKRP